VHCAIRVLTQAQKPTFSGSVDHRINMLDLKKVEGLLKLGRENLRLLVGRGAELLFELDARMDDLRNKRMFYGFWDTI